MKILRSVNRRGFSVGTAGWFTVLKPNTWFPASRLRSTSTSQGFGIQNKGTAARTTGSSAPAGPTDVKAARWQPMEQSEEGRSRAQSASVIFGALAITSAMLWWIMHP